MSITDHYEENCSNHSDINEHLPTLKRYAEECDTVVEMGVRAIVSTWAFLEANPKKLISIDIVNPSKHGKSIDEVYNLAGQANIEFEFRQESTLENEIEECDLLFIDTLHNFEQLDQELKRHGDMAQKYIIFHDTTTFGHRGETSPNGLLPAIGAFLEDNPHWKVKEVFTNNNGLTIIERISQK